MARKKTAKKRASKKKAAKRKTAKKKAIKKAVKVSMDRCVHCGKETRQKSYWGTGVVMNYGAKTMYERVQVNTKRTWRPRVTLCMDCGILYDKATKSPSPKK